jgi:hypothetical protein
VLLKVFSLSQVVVHRKHEGDGQCGLDDSNSDSLVHGSEASSVDHQAVGVIPSRLKASLRMSHVSKLPRLDHFKRVAKPKSQEPSKRRSRIPSSKQTHPLVLIHPLRHHKPLDLIIEHHVD